MEKRGSDSSGDYGYDLAHETVGHARDPDVRTPATTATTSRPSGTSDQAQDYEYDEAHDF